MGSSEPAAARQLGETGKPHNVYTSDKTAVIGDARRKTKMILD